MPLHPRGDFRGDVTAASFGGDLRLGDITPGTPKEVRRDRTRAVLAGEGREFSLSMPVKRASRGTALAWVTGAGIVCTAQEIPMAVHLVLWRSAHTPRPDVWRRIPSRPTG